MNSGSIKPSNDFTDKVMKNVKKRPRKIGAWNIVYFVPILAAIALVSLPATQDVVLNFTSPRHAAVAQVQDDIDGMYLIMTDIEQFSLDAETQEIMSDEQNTTD